jgi:hypothetical protein
MKITAKVKCASRVQVHPDGLTAVSFYPRYEDGANAEWAYATPSLSLMMNVRAEVPFEPGKAYTLTFDDGE